MAKFATIAELNSIAQKMYGDKDISPKTRTRIGVAVLLKNEYQYILLEKRKDSGIWSFPGGGIEPGETIEQCAIREIKEETGFEIKIKRLLGIYSDPNSNIVTFLDNGDMIHLINIFLEATIIQGTLSCSHESECLYFFPEDKLPYNVAPAAIPLLNDLLNKRFDNGPIIR